MKRTYLDTSALRHLLATGSSSSAVTAVLNELDRIVASSALAVTELHRVGRLLPDVSVQDVDAVLESIDLIAITPDQLRAAGLLPDLTSGVQLRSLDAIHLQAALDFGAVEFLTSDRRQADAARAARMQVHYL